MAQPHDLNRWYTPMRPDDTTMARPLEGSGVVGTSRETAPTAPAPRLGGGFDDWLSGAVEQPRAQPEPEEPKGRPLRAADFEPARSPRKGPIVAIVVGVFAALVVALGVGAAVAKFTDRNSVATEPVALSNAAAPTTLVPAAPAPKPVPPPAAAPKPSTPPPTPQPTPKAATPTPQVPPSTVKQSAQPTPKPAAAGAGLEGADKQGFVDQPGARCNAGDPAVLTAKTTHSLVVVCQTQAGRFYYKGMRASDGAGIELDDPERADGGFLATNKREATTYHISNSALVIKRNGTVIAQEQVVGFAAPQ